ncbi:hypothetical protein [Salinicola endophyticus]|uniref:hypothetical protein n=1 Tax=Salinicola endophyticus TaxID=1949083 RepID=UPI001300754B|nr:hypothetical protein [Salinicola endophyticus]
MKIRLYFLFVLLLIVSVVFLVVTAYMLCVPGGLVPNSESWAQFGTYFSGVLTPIFSLFTLLGLLLNIAIQRRELGNSERQLEVVKAELERSREAQVESRNDRQRELEKSDLISMMQFVHGEIQNLYSCEVEFASGQDLGYYFSSSAPSKGEEVIPSNGDDVSPSDRSLLIDLIERVDELNGYLAEYDAKFGMSVVTYFYKKRHGVAYSRLVKKGFMLPSPPPNDPFENVGYMWSVSVGRESSRG